MNSLHPLFVAVLSPISPAPAVIEAAEDPADEPPLFGDDREDYGYEMYRQNRIDADANFQPDHKESTPC